MDSLRTSPPSDLLGIACDLSRLSPFPQVQARSGACALNHSGTLNNSTHIPMKASMLLNYFTIAALGLASTHAVADDLLRDAERTIRDAKSIFDRLKKKTPKPEHKPLSSEPAPATPSPARNAPTSWPPSGQPALPASPATFVAPQHDDAPFLWSFMEDGALLLGRVMANPQSERDLYLNTAWKEHLGNCAKASKFYANQTLSSAMTMHPAFMDLCFPRQRYAMSEAAHELLKRAAGITSGGAANLDDLIHRFERVEGDEFARRDFVERMRPKYAAMLKRAEAVSRVRLVAGAFRVLGGTTGVFDYSFKFEGFPVELSLTGYAANSPVHITFKGASGDLDFGKLLTCVDTNLVCFIPDLGWECHYVRRMPVEEARILVQSGDRFAYLYVIDGDLLNNCDPALLGKKQAGVQLEGLAIRPTSYRAYMLRIPAGATSLEQMQLTLFNSGSF